jgi:hypothetical protein
MGFSVNARIQLPAAYPDFCAGRPKMATGSTGFA